MTGRTITAKDSARAVSAAINRTKGNLRITSGQADHIWHGRNPESPLQEVRRLRWIMRHVHKLSPAGIDWLRAVLNDMGRRANAERSR